MRANFYKEQFLSRQNFYTFVNFSTRIFKLDVLIFSNWVKKIDYNGQTNFTVKIISVSVSKRF